MNGKLQKYKLVLGLLALAVAAWAGTHLQHAFEAATGRHIGETVVLGLAAIGIFLLSKRGG